MNCSRLCRDLSVLCDECDLWNDASHYRMLLASAMTISAFERKLLHVGCNSPLFPIYPPLKLCDQIMRLKQT